MFNSKSKQQKWGYQDLMQYRIHEILLVSSPYDAFILEEDGKLTEQILSEYIGMNLSYAPRVWNAHSAKNATQMIDRLNTEGRYGAPIITEVSALKNYYIAEGYHQNYYKNNKTAPYCMFAIKPKLDKLR